MHASLLWAFTKWKFTLAYTLHTHTCTHTRCVHIHAHTCTHTRTHIRATVLTNSENLFSQAILINIDINNECRINLL